jgi:hypothetical protein
MPHEDLDLTAEGGAIAARAPGADAIAMMLDPVDARTLSIRGYYPGVTFELGADGGLELVHRGRVRLPAGAADDERTPWELFTTRAPVAFRDAPRMQAGP